MNKFMTHLAIVAVAAFGITKASVAWAGSHIYEYYYYSDASYSKVVGIKSILCDDSVHVWGQQTQFVRQLGKERCTPDGNANW